MVLFHPGCPGRKILSQPRLLGEKTHRIAYLTGAHRSIGHPPQGKSQQIGLFLRIEESARHYRKTIVQPDHIHPLPGKSRERSRRLKKAHHLFQQTNLRSRIRQRKLPGRQTRPRSIPYGETKPLLACFQYQMARRKRLFEPLVRIVQSVRIRCFHLSKSERTKLQFFYRSRQIPSAQNRPLAHLLPARLYTLRKMPLHTVSKTSSRHFPASESHPYLGKTLALRGKNSQYLGSARKENFVFSSSLRSAFTTFG